MLFQSVGFASANASYRASISLVMASRFFYHFGVGAVGIQQFFVGFILFHLVDVGVS